MGKHADNQNRRTKCQQPRSSNASDDRRYRANDSWLPPNSWPPPILGNSKAQFPPRLVICGTKKGRFRLSRWGVWRSTAGRRSKSRGGNCRCDNRVTRQANEQNRMRFGLRPQALFKLLRQRRKPPPNLWQFGLDVRDVIAARSLLAMAGKLSAAEARRMVEEKRWALVRAHIACTHAIIKGRSASAARDYFDVYKRAVESNRKRLRHRGRRWPRLRF